MPDVPGPSGKQPAEGDREMIDRELRRTTEKMHSDRPPQGGEQAAQPATEALAPGDEAAAGTPGTGEDICTQCQGVGMLEKTRPCPNCQGTGRVIKAIGGA